MTTGMGIEFSAALQNVMLELSAQQRRAIHRVIAAEVVGEPTLTRLLKTPYSCRYCGWVAGQSYHKRDERKAMLSAHEASCQRRPDRWRFVCNYATWYAKWMHSETFKRCLDAARAEVSVEALAAARRELEFAAPEAVGELRRQVAEGERDLDKRDAAKFILTSSGAAKPQEVDATVRVDDVRQLSDDELDARAAALLARVGSAGLADDPDGEAATGSGA